MKWLGVPLFALFILVESFAQVLEKKGINQLGTIGDLKQFFTISTVTKVVTNPYIMGGVALAIVGLVLWFLLLSQYKINYINPFGSLMYVVITVLAYFMLGETLTVVKMVGVGVIVCGCILINL